MVLSLLKRVLMTLHSDSTFGPQPNSFTDQIPATILVAEDPLINTFLRVVLQRHGHKVVAGNPAQANDLIRRGSVKPDLVVTNKPEAFLSFADTLPLVYIAATPDPALALQFHACRVLRKPFRNEDLLEAVDELSQRTAR
jgi:hypothetical protein